LEGWVKLHRRILDSRYGRNLELRGLFDSLLLMANHREGFTADGTRVLPGQFMTSKLGLAIEFKVSEMKMHRLLNKLKSEGQIDVISSRKNTIITITNWHLYQENDGPTEDQVRTNRGPSEDQSRTNKNAKNVKNKKNDKNISISPLAVLFPVDDEIQAWLTTGTESAQKELLSKYSHHVLVEEVKKAYLWQLEKSPRKAGSFLVTWLSNQKTHGYGANQNKAAFSRVTPDNPTGDPYLAQLNEIRKNGEIA
jgi:hypothetical protein